MRYPDSEKPDADPDAEAMALLRNRLAAEFAREDAHHWGYGHGFCEKYGADEETDAFVDIAVSEVRFTQLTARTGQEAPTPAAPEYVCDVCEDDVCGHCPACTCPACTEVRQISAATVSAEQQTLAAARARVAALPTSISGTNIAASQARILDTITRTGQEG